jgi:hypothetical protein
MPNAHSKFMYWTYSPTFKNKHNFIDPRIIIARHIGWLKNNIEVTDFSTPEPDNYNRAVFTTTPQECLLIEDQIIYYDNQNNGWITLMYVPPEQIEDVDDWICSCNKLAVWCHLKPPRIKQQRSLLWARHNISDTNQTDNERLYTMGYYENLKVKYFSDNTEYVDSLLGEARAILKNYVPEEHDETDCCDDSLC